MAEKSEREIDHTITRNIPRLAKYGVLTVRPGYEITGHQLTGRRAVVTTVHTKKPLAELAPSEKLPDRIGGVPVDVREARPYQRLRAADPLAAELSQRYSRPEDAEPEWPLEREVPSGKLINSAGSHTQMRLAAQAKEQPAAASALATHQQKPTLPYDPKGCPPLVAGAGDRERHGGGEPGCRTCHAQGVPRRHQDLAGRRHVRLHVG